MAMDAVALLKADHQAVEKLFKAFEKAGPRAKATKKRLVASMIKELSVHATIEEQSFYPAARDAEPNTTSLVLESIEEHHIVKWLLDDLEGMDPADERFDAKVTVLIELVRQHIKEEETVLFPKTRKQLGQARLSELGDELRQLRKVAPTRPHPRSPDTPPGNLLAGAVAGTMDKAREAARGLIPGA